MSSLVTHLLSLALRVVRKRPMGSVENAWEWIREPKGEPAPPPWLTRRHWITERKVGGFSTFTVRPRGAREPEKAVLYLHGGTYVSEISAWHGILISRMADAGCRVEVPIYGLAPEHTYREAFGFLQQVYRGLMADVAPARTLLAGDSAGGGLALALAQTLREVDLPQPARLVLISPWTDLTMSNPDIFEVQEKDPWLNPVGIREAAKEWAGGDDLTEPRLSPLYGPMAGLSPMDLYIGTRDLLLPDTRRLHEMVTRAGGEVNLFEEEGALHIHPLLPVPEGSPARARIMRTVEEL
ncbi:alpha/beta hydrolase fold domain-containing protein [Nocardiopsis alkaliphila]|uniref:alpha/beta hydrolase fold domain-containing protein n=1 Tax=Nocardiopsis alkaliphila TaxID=225762 RepID=UPI00034C0CE7|nr:alpha/beta hydrolase fold domain-containing protein [Nocardiopsis alkaliphila]